MKRQNWPVEKLRMTSPDLTDANVGQLAALFPSVVTETVDADGNPKRAIDFDLLRQELSDHVVEGPQERYQLDWPGKRAAAFAANAPIAKTLRPVREESVDFDTTKNLFIEGDNLDALKLLQESYLGKVKLIYIDPPYNTGNDFVYADDFAESTPEYLARSGQVDDSGAKLVANPESNGRFHSDWLSMMYPRLKLARNLLTSDGVLFVSADDHELANLRRLCDEIFGEANFQADISWQKRYTRSNNTQDFTTVVEHILVYSRSSEFEVNLLPRTDEADGRYSNPDNDPRGPWKGASFLNPATPEQRPNLCYPIANPNTGKVTSPTTNAWRRSKEEFDRLCEEGLLYWGAGGTSAVPSIKMFLSEARGLTPVNFWEHTYAGNTDDGTRNVASLFNAKLFDNPKPVKLLIRILEHATGQDSLILDFFGGSGTTAEAIFAKNAEDGGERRFILVQLDEIPHPKSEAAKAGYQTIAAVARERIRRAGHKVLEDGGVMSGDLDVGFRALRIDTTNMTDVLRSPDETDQLALDELESSIKPHRSGEDLLFQVLLDWGLELTMPISVEQIDGREVFVVEEGALIACFDLEVSPQLVRLIAEREPLRAVFRDSAFASDDARINAEQVFREVSPATDVKAI
ncbi:site-specific DNA-methyltransferase [Gordonia hongkongensis]|uniref:site-specific DNA-methyltransferase n=1 Tax=Gordonia hongkongensis TaxID=1701090 RepID=UPI001FF72623|nr:site-specific DNA-methyltransferase [Gordonia hongkongensis]UPG69171.1 site-specific DNA-methyltransferase [Gordonia hongkongensis]